jgi:hypothetical protein
VVVASFGAEEQVDVELAHDLVAAVERSAPKSLGRRGEGKEVTLRVAQEVRRIEPFLRALASRRLGLASILPPHPERSQVLETLVRAKLAEPEVGVREDEILSSIRSLQAS